MTLVEHVESVEPPGQGPDRILTWAWRVEGPGTVVLDPLVVTAGPVSTEVRGGEVQAVAPPDRGDPAVRSIVFPVASDVGQELSSRGPRWVDGQLQIKIDGGERLTREPPGPPPRATRTGTEA